MIFSIHFFKEIMTSLPKWMAMDGPMAIPQNSKMFSLKAMNHRMAIYQIIQHII